MCGLAGIIAQASVDELRTTVARMTRTLAHRGPDGEGVFAAEGVAFGHRRLSIIDLTSAGSQPMRLGNVTIVYNGEVFNFQALRAELVSIGRVFRGQSDTEVLLHAYAEWGLKGLERLEGMFALALWDEGRRRLVLMRDRLGIKPLFFAQSGDRLLFASEIKAILAAGEVNREVDSQALAEYLWYGNAYEDRTIYRDIHMLQPGHRLILEDSRIRTEAWWKIESWLTPNAAIVDKASAIVAVRAAVDTAVARQLVSDVPVGIFLSGGIDSSSIAASAALASGRRLASYAVGFDYQEGVNELPKAREVATALNLDHHELRVSGAAIENVIGSLVRAHDEPFADAANIPLYLLAEALGGAVKVVLQGDGGDEMFGGYRRYSLLSDAHKWRWWPQYMNPLICRLGGRLGVRLARLGAAAGAPESAMRMALLLTVETLLSPPTTLLSLDAQQHLALVADPFLAYKRCDKRFGSWDPVQRMLLTDITLQLPSQFLTKVDRATMALGLEARVPLLDEGVASLAVGMNSKFKVNGAQKKVILRDAMRGRIPEKILDGPKTGFGVPFEHWIRRPLYEFARGALLDDGFINRFDFNRQAIEVALQRHRKGLADHGFMLWKLLQLSLWSREYLR